MDIFDEVRVTDGTTVGEIEFDSFGQARDWLERRGWHEKCGGGFWKGSFGFATTFSRRTPTAYKTVVSIESV